MLQWAHRMLVVALVAIPLASFACEEDHGAMGSTSTWYSCSPCEKMTISRYAKLTDKKPKKMAVVTDAKEIASVLSLLDTLPTEGEDYRSFGDKTELLQIQLSGGETTSVIEFYDGRLKTPATTIMGRGIAGQDELYKLALGLLKK